jgi:hypothetical protein
MAARGNNMARIKAKLISNQASIAWALKHDEAIDRPRGFEVPIVRMLHFWEMYAVEHQKRWESPIGEDYVLGDYWTDIAKGIRGLLNGETGRLDCGTLDSFILETLRENGVETDGL